MITDNEKEINIGNNKKSFANSTASFTKNSIFFLHYLLS